MSVLELLGFSLLINVGMVTANPGLCPFYPRVSLRDLTCYVESNCSRDSQCKDSQKCCENPCGITLCYDIDPDPLIKIEKCPIVVMIEESGCTRTRTKFCFAKDCKRCCNHETTCNPAPDLLTKAENCHTVICAKHACPQQGSVCFVDEVTNKPLCRCISSCSITGKFVCASDEKNSRTFRNNCYMDKDACHNEKKYKLEYLGRCLPPTKIVVPVQRPTVTNSLQYNTVGSSATANCIGDRDFVQLSWVQKRADGKEIEIDFSLQRDRGLYSLNGRSRRVLTISIPHVGHGSFGIYACKQKYDNIVMETELHIKPLNEVLFDRKCCKLSRDNGTCNGKFPNYYYDHREQKCKRFAYTGCAGNENNFQTMNECNIKCGDMKPVNISTALTRFGGKCGSRVCNFYEKCFRRFLSAKCICQEVCSLVPNPVCASNGKTYISLCAMKVEACRWRKSLVAVYAGKCGPYQVKSSAISQVITTTRKPLSLCELKRCPPYAKCFVHPFTRIPLCYCEKTCPFFPRIICASDRKHYLNECFMRISACKEKRKLTVLKRGLCLFNNQLDT